MNRTLGLDFGVNASDRSTAAWMSGVIFVTLTIWTVFLDEAGKYVLYTLPFTLGTIYLYFKNGVIRWNRAGVQSLFLYVSIALISMVLNSSFNFQALREVAIVAGYLLLLTLWFRAPASTADYCLGVLAVGMVVSALIVASALILAGKVSSVWISVPMYVLSSLLAVWLIFGIFRSGRL